MRAPCLWTTEGKNEECTSLQVYFRQNDAQYKSLFGENSCLIAHSLLVPYTFDEDTKAAFFGINDGFAHK